MCPGGATKSTSLRSCSVNALGTAHAPDMDHRQTDALDALFRAHYSRVSPVMHDWARANEIAGEAFLK